MREVGDEKKKDHWYIPDAFQRLFRDYQPSRSPPIEKVEETFWELLEESPQTYIVVDALDECSCEDTRLSVMEFLQSFQKNPNGDNHVMITSRWLEDANLRLKPKNTIHMAPENVNGDIKRYLDAWLESMTWTHSLKMQVMQKLIEKADGVFRWVALQRLNLLRCKREIEVNQALKELPKNLEETYKVMLERIYHLHYEPVLSVIKWLAYSRRPLRLGEVAEIAVIRYTRDSERESTLFQPEDRYPSIDAIRSILSGLIVVSGVEDEAEIIEGGDGRVSFSHFTVQEYLEGPNTVPSVFHLDETEAHWYITSSSLSYIRYYDSVSNETLKFRADEMEVSSKDNTNPSLDTAKQDPSRCCDLGPGENICHKRFPLLLYAIKYWWRHYLAFQSRSGQLRKANNCGLDDHIGPVLQLSIETGLTDEGYDHIGLENICSSYFPSFTIHEVRRDFEFDWEAKESLHRAARTNDLQLIKILVDAGVDINMKSRSGLTPLAIAAFQGHIEATIYLVQQGATTDIADFDNIVHIAIRTMEACSAAVCLTDDHEIEGIPKQQKGWTPLHWAVKRGHRLTATKLIEFGADIFHSSRLGLTPFGLAMMMGQEDVVEAMIRGNNEACVAWQSTGLPGWRAIHFAAVYRNETIMGMLLDAGAQLNLRAGDKGLSPLDLAAIGTLAYCKGLAYQGSLDIAKMIAQNVVCGDASSAIAWLIRHGATMKGGGPCDQSPLHFAALYGQLRSTIQLLENNAELEAENSQGLTPLANAVFRGHDAVVKEFISRGANVDAVAKGNTSLLIMAAAHERRGILEQLMRAKANPFIRHKGSGMTALDYAEDADDYDLVEILTKYQDDYRGWISTDR
ncbi:ankyrin repeat-containing domain protein [Camillea tinctor]|nr:ankyrin repeat-containing domain protein [Camillea tinctor]